MNKDSKVLNNKELDNQQLESVAGGRDTITTMYCPNCGKVMDWAGSFYGQVFRCSCCGQNSFKGVYEY